MAKTPKTPKRIILPEEWKKIRAVWEADAAMTFATLSKRLGGQPTGQAIGQRAKRETWTRVDTKSPEIQKKIAERADQKSARAPQPPQAQDTSVPALPGEPLPLSKHAAIEQRAAVLDRHRRELNLPRQRIYAALNESDFNKAKLAKISAETLSIVQASERKAWGLDGDPTIVFQVIPPSPRDERE
jgi:hypothetical protein